jgi:hypothetical protein
VSKDTPTAEGFPVNVSGGDSASGEKGFDLSTVGGICTLPGVEELDQC